MKNNSIIRSISLFAAALGLSMSTSQAVNVTKLDTTTMNGGALDWSAAPATTDVGEFTATPTAAHLAAMTLGGTMTLGGLQLDNTMAGPLVIASTGGFYYTNGVNGINMSAANQNLTFNNLLALSTNQTTVNQTWLVGSAQTLTVNGVVSGPGSLTIGDGTPGNSGAVVFGGQANVFTGGLTNNGGTLTFGAAASAGTGTITIQAGGIISTTGPTINNPLNVIGTGSISNNGVSAVNLTLDGNVTGNGTLNLSELGAGSTGDTITFNGSAGQLSGFTGTIKFSDSAPIPSFLRLYTATGSTAATWDLGNGNIVFFNRQGQAMMAGALKGGAGTSVQGARSSGVTSQFNVGYNGINTTYYGTISNGSYSSAATLSVAKYGSGTLTLAGPNAYTLSTTFNGGFLNAGSVEGYVNGGFGVTGPFGTPTTPAGSLLFGGGTLQYSAVNQYDYSPRFSTAGNQPISIDENGQNVIFATALAGTGTSLTNMDTAGGGSLTLTAAETYTGPTVVTSGGHLKLSGSGALTSGTTLSIQPGGTFDVSALSSPYTVAVTVAGTGTGTSSSTAATIVPAPAEFSILTRSPSS